MHAQEMTITSSILQVYDQVQNISTKLTRLRHRGVILNRHLELSPAEEPI